MIKINAPLSTALITAAFFAASGCSGPKVKTDQDPQVNLAHFKTYAWAPEVKQAADKPNASILDETVKSAVDQQLATKGLTKVPDYQADMLVSYSANAKNHISHGVAPGYYGWWGPPPEDAYATKEGMLTLQFVDPKIHQTVWQGSAVDAIGDAGASQKEITAAVKDMLQKYPVA